MKLRLGNLTDTTDLLTLIGSLDKVKKKGREDWNPIDIVGAIAQGSAQFLIGEHMDCLVFYTKKQDWTDSIIFWIWTAYSKHPNAIEYYQEDLKEVAAIMNCTKINWSSKRVGYIRKMKTLAADVHQIEYSINL